MSDTSSIICLDDFEDEVIVSNRAVDEFPNEQLWAVVDYVEFNNSTGKEDEFSSIKEPPDEPTVPILKNTNNNSEISCNGDKIDNKAKEDTEIISVCLDDSDEDDKKLMDIGADYTTTCFLTPLYEVENSNVICEEDNNRKYECKTCEKFFFSRKALLTHYKSHYKEEQEEKKKNRINCSICKKYFNHEKDFAWHEPECKGRLLAKQSNRNSRRITRSQNNVLL